MAKESKLTDEHLEIIYKNAKDYSENKITKEQAIKNIRNSKNFPNNEQSCEMYIEAFKNLLNGNKAINSSKPLCKYFLEMIKLNNNDKLDNAFKSIFLSENNNNLKTAAKEFAQENNIDISKYLQNNKSINNNLIEIEYINKKQNITINAFYNINKKSVIIKKGTKFINKDFKSSRNIPINRTELKSLGIIDDNEFLEDYEFKPQRKNATGLSTSLNFITNTSVNGLEKFKVVNDGRTIKKYLKEELNINLEDENDLLATNEDEKKPQEEVNEFDNLENNEELDIKTQSKKLYKLIPAVNKIFYGIPGSGKSYKIDNEYFVDYEKENSKIETEKRYHTERIVFYPDYTYSDFVGQVMPYTKQNDSIGYKFIPGPFTLILEQALIYENDENNDTLNFALIIEEINRGNAAAIFGDIFQLLDRDENGKSKYSITNHQIYKYLTEDSLYKETIKQKLKNNKIHLPNNLSLIATMNTTDQNLYVLDSAFTRRWELVRITNSFNNCDFSNWFIPINGYNITWKDFSNEINKIIREQSKNNFGNEDKELGAFFINKNYLITKLDNFSNLSIKNTRFSNKVLKYLWNDVFKQSNRNLIFNETCKNLDDVIIKFKDNDISCFNEDLQSIFKPLQVLNSSGETNEQ